jgi:hypothetical protein
MQQYKKFLNHCALRHFEELDNLYLLAESDELEAYFQGRLEADDSDDNVLEDSEVNSSQGAVCNHLESSFSY